MSFEERTNFKVSLRCSVCFLLRGIILSDTRPIIQLAFVCMRLTCLYLPHVFVFAILSCLAYVFIDESSFRKINSFVVVANDCDELPSVDSTRIIHQAYGMEPYKFLAFNRNSWISLHPKWRYILWNDKSNSLLIRCRLPEFTTK